MDKYVTYEESGVSVDDNEELVHQIHGEISKTFDPDRVISMANGFAGLFQLDPDNLFKKGYEKPVMVACTDGVGTKVMVAQDMKKFDTLGIDLVAMNLNDMLVIGAEPAFFLDYLAVDRIHSDSIMKIIRGIVRACRDNKCSFIGGETAEMPDIYKKDEFDLAGFAVGTIDRNKIIDGKRVRDGDVILGLPSSGLHSNGYTLARNICFKKLGLKVTDRVDELDGLVLGDVLLEPTRIYVGPIIKLLKQYKVKKIVHGMAHITGGGLVGNIPRVLPKDCDATIKKSSWPKQKIFTFLQNAGPVEEEEMFSVFNMGIGFVLIVSEDFANSIANKLTRFGERVYTIGRITTGTGKVVLK
ncbi:MAG: phosphoribosylformylglycinamidine cyclo-ligase [Planctomycetota bacterium]|jgi:phosphoribosylformylglycinamidine cyclo-ligase